MRSSDGSDIVELERIPTTREDVEALRRLRQRSSLTTEEYLRALTRLPPPPREALRKRRGPGGREPFRL